MQDQKISSYEFGEWRLDLRERFLWFRGEPVEVPPKAVDLLCILVEKHGEVATKDEIWARVWNDAFVEETNLTHNIYLLRRMFRELAGENPIRTVPRRGYRFASAVRGVDRESLEIVVERSTQTRLQVEEELDEDPKALALLTLRMLFRSRVAVGLFAALLVASALFAIWRVGFANPAEESQVVRSIAVLPLRTLNHSESNDLFALGLTDSLISDLGRLNRFAVRPFSSVEKYSAAETDALRAGRELSVDAVLEGTVMRSGSRMRVNVRLIKVSSGDQLWASSFDGGEGDLLDVQEAVSYKVASVLLRRITLRERELLSRRPTRSQDAYTLYLSGRERWLRRDWQADSLPFFRKAIEIDPGFALAYLGLADQLAISGKGDEAEENVSKALELDPDLYEAWATRGFIQMFCKWDWQAAKESLAKAVEMAPNSPKAHHWYGVYFAIRGDLERAVKEMEAASDLDPTALIIRSDIGEVYYFKREYRKAEEVLESVVRADPSFSMSRQYLVKVRFKLGKSYFKELASFANEEQERMKVEGISPARRNLELEKITESSDESAIKNHLLKNASENAAANPAGNLDLGMMRAVAGEKKPSLDALGKALKARAFRMPFIAVDPIFDPVRAEPEFKELVARIGLGG